MSREFWGYGTIADLDTALRAAAKSAGIAKLSACRQAIIEEWLKDINDYFGHPGQRLDADDAGRVFAATPPRTGGLNGQLGEQWLGTAAKAVKAANRS